MMENQGQRISGKPRLAWGSARHGVCPLLTALNFHLTWSLLVFTFFTRSPQHPLTYPPCPMLALARYLQTPASRNTDTPLISEKIKMGAREARQWQASASNLFLNG